jgi:CelD/BcsL family acetyltransferase involved in cellulose biosynthesis
MSKLVVEEMRGVEILETLRSEWQMLFRTADASPFLSCEWIAAWHQWFGRNVVPYVLCARSDNKLVGLLALGEEKRCLPLLPIGVQRLFFLGEDAGGADYLDVLSLPGYEREAASAIFDHLAYHGTFDVLDLDSMATDSPSLPLLMQRFDTKKGFHYRLTPRFVCPQVKFEFDWADILKQSRRANNFKRRLQQLRKHKGFEYKTITHPEEIGVAFERFLVLHEARWDGKGGSSATGHEVRRAFHRDVVNRLAHAGLIRFDELWLEGACRASIYGIDDGHYYYFYNSGYDPDWKSISPGMVLLGLSLEAAVKRGIKVYDFLRGEENYKFDWANSRRETVCVHVSRSHPLVAFFIACERARIAVRTAVRNMLPESAVELLRRWRQSRKHT